jgi:predicted 2-oxoglutarate/Fe(II)-dependent dioxygenase YbiX
MDYTYKIIDDFLTKQDVADLLEMVIANSGPDGKPNFEGTAMLDETTFVEGGDTYPTEIDPNKLLLKIKNKIQDYYLSTYEMKGDFVFSRLYGCSMFEGAYLPDHRDEDPNPQGKYDGKKRSHVCSIILNEDFEGGELNFSEQGVKVKGKPGDMILFPGYYVSHGVEKITKGVRRVILVFFYDMLR